MQANGALTGAEASSEEAADVTPSASKQPQLNEQTRIKEQTRWQDFVDADEAEQDAQGEALFVEWRAEQELERLARLRKRLGREAKKGRA